MQSLVRSVTLGLVLGVTSVAAYAPAVQAEQAHQAQVPIADARAKALSLVPGTIVGEELEHEKGRWIYSFEVKPAGEKGKLVKEVNIDADTGALVGPIETEND